MKHEKDKDPTRLRDCYIGKAQLNAYYPLSFNVYTGRYTSNGFMNGAALTADEIEELFHVFDKDKKRIV